VPYLVLEKPEREDSSPTHPERFSHAALAMPLPRSRSRRPKQERVLLHAPVDVAAVAYEILGRAAGVEVVEADIQATIIVRLHRGPPLACDVLVRGAEGGHLAAWLEVSNRRGLNARAAGALAADRIVAFLRTELVDPCPRPPASSSGVKKLGRLLADLVG
jgi:hypothetical protein